MKTNTHRNIGAAVLVAAQLVGATPASAVTGLHKVTGPLSPIDSQSPKTVRAFCPPGEDVIGGGGQVFAVSAVDSAKVTLTQLQPVQRGGSRLAQYVVTGAETTPGITGNWWVQAYALCVPASSLSGYQIVPEVTDPSSKPVQATAAVCPGGKVVIGTGGRIIQARDTGQVVLQVARASGPGDIARVQAHEDADGYAGIWRVVSYAICVNPLPGYRVVFRESPERASESIKSAVAECPGDTRVHGAGAAITNTAPGNVSLQVVYPFNDLKRVRALAVENTPTNQNWDFIVAAAICAF
jgi:hypothetical protein